MPFSRQIRRLAVILGKRLVFLLAAVLVTIGLAISILETGWAKNQIRLLIVRQANQYLTATLEIGRLQGSLVRGIELGDIRLSRAGRTLIAIDDVVVSYSLREIFQHGVVIKRIRLARPRVAMARTPDGRWDLAELVKRQAEQEKRTGPGRPIEIDAIEIYDGSVMLNDALDFGAVHAPTRYESLNVRAAFSYEPVSWRLMFASASWRGYEPDLSANHLSGGIDNGPGGISFNRLAVDTPKSSFVLAGRIRRDGAPAELDLNVHAERFAFQEWAGVLHGLKNIAVDAAFDTTLKGPLAKLATHLNLRSTAGSITGSLTLDTTVPGWRGAGQLDVARLNLARWLNRLDRPSDISGRVAFDLALELGRHFPRGSYDFSGPHVEFMRYAADDLRARGVITPTDVLIAQATARAYGADVRATESSIGLDEPFPFRFHGKTSGVDLRAVPQSIPVPHVESVLTFDYDVYGQFSDAFIRGRAEFARSELTGAILEPGTIGTVDTAAKPLQFTGEGGVKDLDLHRLATGFEIAWLQDPRYAGTLSGRFHTSGSGTDRESLVLDASGRIAHADLFNGTLTDATVTLAISGGTLQTSYDGHFANLDPQIPLADSRLDGSITGKASVRTTVRELLTRTPQLVDYDIEGTVVLEPSMIHDIRVDRAQLEGQLRDGLARLTRIETSGPVVEGSGSGTLAFTSDGRSDFQYDLTRLDLSPLKALTGFHAAGQTSTAGRLTGPWSAPNLAGDATIDHFGATDIDALTMSAHYDATLPRHAGAQPSARITGRASFLTLFGRRVQTATATLNLADHRLGFDLSLTQADGRSGSVAGHAAIHRDRRTVEIDDLDVVLGRGPWRLARDAEPALVTWTDEELQISPVVFIAAGNADQRIGIGGTWRQDGHGTLRVTAAHVFLETLQGAYEQPARYGGVLDLDGTLAGTRAIPAFAGHITISNGRVQRVSYQKLEARVDFSHEMFHVNARLDQSAAAWVTAVGSVPLAVFNRKLPERDIDCAIVSSPISLGLLEGLTDVVRNASGEARLDIRAIGTSHDPHFQGIIALSNAAFLVNATGARYKNGRAMLSFARDRVIVEQFHLEDNGSHPLDVRGSLGTHELSVGDLVIDATARHFNVIRRDVGDLDVDATLQLRGRLETPRISGDITINGGNLKADTILEQTLFRPYSTEPTPLAQVDAVAALNPWERLALDITLHVPETLKLTGENVQVSPGTPIGLGDINLRVGGDLYLYKDAGQPLSVTGSLDSISGTYAFQGRRFDIDETSSINFRGDLKPDIYVSVTRLISGVLTRVSVTGNFDNPELHLSSTPPLDPSDILSLIVFNTSLNDLSATQQQELAVRAGTLAAGFLAEPLVSAIEGALGLETLEVEPSADVGNIGPKITIGEEIAPGLVARFSRQFGQDPYDQATIEYYLSRLFRIRASFSDAASLIARSPFRRIERAGVDLLFFFSF